MRAYWNNLNEREQKLSFFTLVFLIIYLLYSLVFAPLSNGINERLTKLQEKQETLLWMQGIDKNKNLQRPIKSLTDSELLSTLTLKLNNSFKAFPYKLQRVNSGDVQLLFEQVPFNKLIQWLHDFSNQYKINIKQMNIECSKVSGVVKLSITLSVND